MEALQRDRGVASEIVLQLKIIAPSPLPRFVTVLHVQTIQAVTVVTVVKSHFAVPLLSLAPLHRGHTKCANRSFSLLSAVYTRDQVAGCAD